MAKLFADYLKEADENPAAIIMSVAELMRKDMDADNEVAKTSIPFFLMQLRNAGLPISYSGLKAYYNAHPELKNVIQTFNDEDIIFVGQGDEADGETLGEPQGDIPPEEVVDNMAKRAMNKRMNEARVPEDDLNWVATGGEFGKKRRFPGYIIKKEGIKYNAYDEDNMDLIAGGMSLEGLARMLKPYIDRRIGGGWELSEENNELPYDNADFMVGFIIPWTQKPTKDYQMPLVDYVKRNVPDGNQKYAYSLVAKKLEELIDGGMKAINSYARQNYQYLVNMKPEVKKTLGLDDTMIEGKDQGASKEEEDEFHVALDDLVHKTFGHSSMEKKKKMEDQEDDDYREISVQNFRNSKAAEAAMIDHISASVYDKENKEIHDKIANMYREAADLYLDEDPRAEQLYQQAEALAKQHGLDESVIKEAASEEFDYWQSPESLAKLAGITEAKADPKIVAKFAGVPGSQRSYYIMKWAEENGIDGNEAMELAGYVKGSYMGYGTYNWRYVGESDISERKLTGGEKRSREANVKKLKKHKGDFEKRYGKDAESVMYAVATKRAKGD